MDGQPNGVTVDTAHRALLDPEVVPATTKQPLPEIVDRKKVAAARAGRPADDIVRDAVDVFKVLASPVRIGIIHALAHQEMSVGDLARALDLSLSVASHQLALLRTMRLVAARDQGRLAFYRVTDALVGRLVHACLVQVGEAHQHPHRVSRPRKERR